MMVPQGGRRQALREATRDAHAPLDESVGNFADIGDYRRYLAAMLGFRNGAETALNAAAWPGAWTWRPVGVTSDLLADAADLEVEPPRWSARIAPPRDVSALLGMLYVLEGSALGAKVLRRRAARLGLRDDFGARHLATQAAGAAGWRTFMAKLEDSADFDLPCAIGAASATFAAARDCFEDGSRVAA